MRDREGEVAARGERGERDRDARQVDEGDHRQEPDDDQRMADAGGAGLHQRLPRKRSRSKRRSAISTSTPTISISSTDERRAERPVLGVGEGDLDVVGDRDHLLAAEHLVFGDGADREDEGEQAADDEAGRRQRQLDLLEHLPAARAEVGRGLARIVRHHRDAEREREQHERQVDIDHAEEDRAGGEQHALRLDPEERLERAEEHAVLDQEQHPAVEAHVLRHEQRDDEEQRHQRRPAAEDPDQAVGHGIGDDDQDQHGRRRRGRATRGARCSSSHSKMVT